LKTDLLSFFENFFDYFSESINNDTPKDKALNKYLNTLKVNNELSTDKLSIIELNSNTANIPDLKVDHLSNSVISLDDNDNSITLNKSPLLKVKRLINYLRIRKLTIILLQTITKILFHF